MSDEQNWKTKPLEPTEAQRNACDELDRALDEWLEIDLGDGPWHEDGNEHFAWERLAEAAKYRGRLRGDEEAHNAAEMQLLAAVDDFLEKRRQLETAKKEWQARQLASYANASRALKNANELEIVNTTIFNKFIWGDVWLVTHTGHPDYRIKTIEACAYVWNVGHGQVAEERQDDQPRS